MENKKAAPPLLEETATQNQSNYTNFLRKLQPLRPLPIFPFLQPESVSFLIVLALLLQLLLMWVEVAK